MMGRLIYLRGVFIILGLFTLVQSNAQSFSSGSASASPVQATTVNPPPPPPKLKAAARVTAVPPRLETGPTTPVAVVDPSVLPVAPALLQALYLEARLQLARTDGMDRAIALLKEIGQSGYSAANQLLGLLGVVVSSAKAADTPSLVAAAIKPIQFSAPLTEGAPESAPLREVITDYSFATEIQGPVILNSQFTDETISNALETLNAEYP
jgi:hypothetical protein